MMLKKIRLMASIALLLAVAPIANSSEKEPHVSNCSSGEQIFFSCIMSNKKTLSLCGNEDSLSYQYGKKDSIEMTYPSNKERSLLKFKYNNHFRYKADYFRVSFTNGKYSYHVYRDIDEEENPQIKAGINIERTDKDQSFTISCKEIVKDDLKKLSDRLRCDTNSALGCPGQIEN